LITRKKRLKTLAGKISKFLETLIGKKEKGVIEYKDLSQRKHGTPTLGPPKKLLGSR
jgi:hypothetical protein